MGKRQSRPSTLPNSAITGRGEYVSVETGRKSLPRPAGGVTAWPSSCWRHGQSASPSCAGAGFGDGRGRTVPLALLLGSRNGPPDPWSRGRCRRGCVGIRFSGAAPGPDGCRRQRQLRGGRRGPGGRSWSNGANASWTWEAGTASAGSRSMRLSIPGTVARRGPSLISADLPLRPGTPYSFRGRIRTAGLTGALTLSLVERRSDGGLFQRSVKGPTGTADWTEVEMAFRPPSGRDRLVQGRGVERLGYCVARRGTAPRPLRRQNSLGLRRRGHLGRGRPDPDGECADLDLRARFTSVGPAIRVDATLTTSRGATAPSRWSSVCLCRSPARDGSRTRRHRSRSHREPARESGHGLRRPDALDLPVRHGPRSRPRSRWPFQ